MFEGIQVTCRSCSLKAILVHCVFPSKVDQNQLFGPKSTFEDQNRFLTRDHNFRRFNGSKYHYGQFRNVTPQTAAIIKKLLKQKCVQKYGKRFCWLFNFTWICDNAIFQQIFIFFFSFRLNKINSFPTDSMAGIYVNHSYRDFKHIWSPTLIGSAGIIGPPYNIQFCTFLPLIFCLLENPIYNLVVHFQLIWPCPVWFQWPSTLDTISSMHSTLLNRLNFFSNSLKVDQTWHFEASPTRDFELFQTLFWTKI